MLFNSIHYLVFFPLVVAVFFALPHAGRKWFLLAAGNVFYGWWDWRFLILLWFSIVVDFFMALKIAASEDPIRRKFYLVCSLSVGLGILGFFKYFNFFADSAVRLAGTAGIELHPVVLQIILPVGVSFYTFQSLGYALDVYRRRTEPERDFWLYSLFVCFFPQMVAGPIERSTHLLPQLRQVVRFDYRRAVDGLLLIGWGLFKKLVIADRAALLVNQVYNHPGDHAGLPVWLATYLFAFQIYCDFSGYSDIAVGSARVLGYDVMRNFRRPYLARSIADFWQRWHISLSTWFRDYLYIPLGGNRVGRGRWYFNLMAVFVISGLWHGANWTFVVWGTLHGMFMVVEAATAGVWGAVGHKVGWYRLPGRVRELVQMALIFHLVCFGWIFFRAKSIGDALTLVRGLAGFRWEQFAHPGAYGLPAMELGILAAAILAMEAGQVVFRGRSASAWLADQPRPLRWAVYYGLVMVLLMFGEFAGAQQFIYFQF